MATFALPSTRTSTRRMAGLVSFVLFIAVCACAAYWAMQLFKPPARPVAPAPQEKAAPVNTSAAGSLFGGRGGDAAVASNFQLRGLVLASSLAGTSLIMSIDGKPAQAYRADREIAPGVTVKEVHPGYVLLSDNGVPKRVELPADVKPSGGGAPARGNEAAASGRNLTPPPRTMPSPANTPAANSPAANTNPSMQTQQGQQPQAGQAGAQQAQQNPPQQQVPPGTPVPASQVSGASSGASGVAGTGASGSGQAAQQAQPTQPAQQPVVVQSPPTVGGSAIQAPVQEAIQAPAVLSPQSQGAVVHSGSQQLPGTAPTR